MYRVYTTKQEIIVTYCYIAQPCSNFFWLVRLYKPPSVILRNILRDEETVRWRRAFPIRSKLYFLEVEELGIASFESIENPLPESKHERNYPSARQFLRVS